MRPAEAQKWNSEPLSNLMKYIVEHHHEYCRKELARLGPLLERVALEYGDRHPELGQIKVLFAGLNRELVLHLVKEEQTLFPHIADLEEAVKRGEAPPRPSYGTVANPVRFMIIEHGSNYAVLKEIRRLSNGFELPADAGAGFRELYEGLKHFEEDMLEHTVLEDDVVFPRAIALENAIDGHRAAGRTQSVK